MTKFSTTPGRVGAGARFRAGFAVVALLAVGAAPEGAQAQQPSMPEPHYQAAHAAFTSGNVTKANLEVKLALQANPTDAASHFLLGCLLERQGQTDQAIVGFQQALALNPTNPETLYNLGTLLLRKERRPPHPPCSRTPCWSGPSTSRPTSTSQGLLPGGTSPAGRRRLRGSVAPRPVQRPRAQESDAPGRGGRAPGGGGLVPPASRSHGAWEAGRARHRRPPERIGSHVANRDRLRPLAFVGIALGRRRSAASTRRGGGLASRTPSRPRSRAGRAPGRSAHPVGWTRSPQEKEMLGRIIAGGRMSSI